MTRPYSKPLCACQHGCAHYTRLADAWHTRRRLEQMADKAADEWRAAVDAYNAHLRMNPPRLPDREDLEEAA